MSDHRDSVSIVLLSFFQPFLSTLGPVLFLQAYFRDRFLFHGIYLLLLIVLISGGILLFRPFCRKNLYVFEDLGSAMTERIALAVWLVSLATALAAVRFSPQLFPLAIPLGVALLLTYSISLFHFLQSNKIGGIVSLTYRHIKMLNSFVFAIMASRFFFILIVFFLEFPPVPSIPMSLGFAADIVLILFLRADGNRLEIQKEGFSYVPGKGLRSGFPSLLFLFAIITAVFTSGRRSLLNPRLLKRFYLWLMSLSKDMPLRYGEIDLDAGVGGPTPEEMEGMHSYWEARKVDFAFLRKIFDIIEYVMIFIIALLIIYFVFYPIIAPFLFRNRKKMSFRQYYSSVLRGIRDFFRSFFRLIETLFQKQKVISENAQEGAGFKASLGRPGFPASAAKRSELRSMYKLYGKLKFKGARHLKSHIDHSRSVGEFFTELSKSNSQWADNCSLLIILFNKSFFSPERLSPEEMRELKGFSGDLLKEL